MLTAGTKAPGFSLPDQDGKLHTLEEFAGRKLVLYFYPKDNTSGCSRQAAAFAQLFGRYQALGVPVVGVSKDSAASHQKFAQKYQLPFLLLSDPDLQAIQAYDVWQEKKLYGKVSMGVVRTSYLIDEQGMIQQVWEKAKPDTNASQILEVLEK